MSILEKLPSIIRKHQLGSEIKTYQIIQELWSGYGVLARVQTDSHQFVIKQISFPDNVSHPKGHDSLFAHERKVKSYQVEMSFYANYQEHRGISHTPELVAISNETDNYLILEDLQSLGFKPKREISVSEIELCIKWLAGFHYTYLAARPKNLWNTGTYWHLETRPQEFQIMRDGPLKEYAELVDQKLSSANYQTILHGDAKLANFLFSEDRVSAVDFQYCGGGVGVKDLAYFLSSVFNEEELFGSEKEILDLYFHELFCLGAREELIESWRGLYPYAWFDFYRFLAGWSPDHYKINKYIKTQMNKVLDEIN